MPSAETTSAAAPPAASAETGAACSRLRRFCLSARRLVASCGADRSRVRAQLHRWAGTPSRTPTAVQSTKWEAAASTSCARLASVHLTGAAASHSIGTACTASASKSASSSCLACTTSSRGRRAVGSSRPAPLVMATTAAARASSARASAAARAWIASDALSVSLSRSAEAAQCCTSCVGCTGTVAATASSWAGVALGMGLGSSSRSRLRCQLVSARSTVHCVARSKSGGMLPPFAAGTSEGGAACFASEWMDGTAASVCVALAQHDRRGSRTLRHLRPRRHMQLVLLFCEQAERRQNLEKLVLARGGKARVEQLLT
eukprot:scaffold5375_cov110-Isochrysis_galbana.AAC.3